MAKLFISYSHDNSFHKEWVRKLTDDLIEVGLETTCDIYDLNISDDKHMFMEQSIQNSSHILCICTPNYVQKANKREGGVGEETSLITINFYEKHQEKKYIPCVRVISSDITVRPTPNYLANLIYIDFQDDAYYKSKLEELIRYIYNAPKLKKPKPGNKPSFEKKIASSFESKESNEKGEWTGGKLCPRCNEYAMDLKAILEMGATVYYECKNCGMLYIENPLAPY